MELWVVGGAVRDCALGRPLRDLDLACNARSAEEVARLAGAILQRLGGDGEVREEPRFGTAAVSASGRNLELAALRTERYERPGALPTVRLGASIEADLPRRDFSVNAIALGLTGHRSGELVDPFGGLDDLARRRLRVLHERSFIDDATRLWRGARYAAELGLRPNARTRELIIEGGRWLEPISGRRILAEVERIASIRRVGRAFALLEEWGVLGGAHADWALSEESRRALRHRPGPHKVDVLLAVLLAPLPAREAVLDRLAAPSTAHRAVEDAARLLATTETSPERLSALERCGDAGRTAARWLDPERQRALQAGLRRWERTQSPLDAAALLRLAVHEGPELGAWLARLRRERFLGTLNDAAAARRLVRAELASSRARG